jgi:16S rRNA (uracil1498-N3)-methyltransferase
MARRLFFVDQVRSGECEVTGERARHLRTVLRVEPGQIYEVSDNQRVYLAEVRAVRNDRVTFGVLGPAEARQAPVRLALLAALVKFDRLELLLEKATELGVERAVLVVAARSERGLERAAAKRMDRWRRILLEAGQQARRARLPELAGPVRFEEALRETADYRYVLDESGAAEPLWRALPAARSPQDAVALLVGPEGGWSEQERNQTAAADWRPVSLGRQILRSETAAIAALAVVGCAWEAGEG